MATLGAASPQFAVLNGGVRVGSRERASRARGRLHVARMTNNQWQQAIADYETWMKAAARSDETIDLRDHQLRRLARAFPDGPWTITTDQLTEWLASHGWCAETLRSHRSALIAFYRWAIDTGRISHSPAAETPPVRRVKPHVRPTPEAITSEALSSADLRTGVMIRLARLAGLRRGEIARAHTDDLLGEDDGWWLIVHGKGGKERIVPLDQETVTYLHRWMDGRKGYFFPGAIDGHLSARRVGELVTEQLAGPWTTHTLRHRYATEAYKGSHDLFAVQQLLGHSKPETTQVYVDIDREALRGAARYAYQKAAA